MSKKRVAAMVCCLVWGMDTRFGAEVPVPTYDPLQADVRLVGSGESGSTTSSMSLRAGEANTFWVGLQTEPSHPRCLFGMSTSSPQSVTTAQRIWEVTTRVESVHVDLVTLDVQWRHRRREADGTFTTVREDRRRTFVGGRRAVILDAVRRDEVDTDCDFPLFTIQLEANLASSPSLTRARVIYDAWLEHAASGRVVRRHDREERRHTEPVQLGFAELRRPAIRDGCEMVLQGQALLYSRAREDGRVDIGVNPFMTVGLAPAGGDLTDATGAGSGVRRLTVESGETVRFVVPNDLPGGLPAHGPCATPTGHAALADLLRGTQTSFLVRVRRVDPA